MCKCVDDLFKNEYTFGAKVLRLAFGILFLLVAAMKLRVGYGSFAEGLIVGDGNLAREIPEILLYVYGMIIPGAELAAGAALILNKYVREAYATIALIYLSFMFGQMYDGNTVKSGTEYIPALMALSLAAFFEVRAGGKKKRLGRRK